MNNIAAGSLIRAKRPPYKGKSAGSNPVPPILKRRDPRVTIVGFKRAVDIAALLTFPDRPSEAPCVSPGTPMEIRKTFRRSDRTVMMREDPKLILTSQKTTWKNLPSDQEIGFPSMIVFLKVNISFSSSGIGDGA